MVDISVLLDELSEEPLGIGSEEFLINEGFVLKVV